MIFFETKIKVKRIKEQKIVSIPNLTKKAQDAFNKWIRMRDEGLPCISCGSMNANQGGHFLSAGHHSAFRFSEINCNLQCTKCNCFLGGNLLNYREGMIKKYGLERVLMLENAAKLKKAKKWSRFELLAICQMYKIK